MCGIVGYVGSENAVSYLLNGLKKLEYRGYDSSGIVVGKFENNEPKFYLYKKVGKLKQLISALPKELSGSWGIGHTRWATHGLVTDQNAHPFYSQNKKIAVVHNGIIENFQSLRKSLKDEGYIFSSETDSEVIPNLVEKYYSGNLLEAVQKALDSVIGTYALAITSVCEPEKIVVAKRGGPIVIGIAENAYYIASDVNAIVGNTNRVPRQACRVQAPATAPPCRRRNRPASGSWLSCCREFLLRTVCRPWSEGRSRSVGAVSFHPCAPPQRCCYPLQHAPSETQTLG